MFSFFNKTKIGGDIGYYNLQEWWLSTFTEEERNYIEKTFCQLGSNINEHSLTKGKISFSSQSCAGFLQCLSGWFNNKEHREIAKKIIKKAYKEAIKGNDILDLHFTLYQIQEINYPDRDIDPNALNIVIKACEEQIKIAPLAIKAFKKEYPKQTLPSHGGYERLRIIYKKRGEFQKAIDLCKQAKKQGWSGCWDKQIEDLNRSLKRSDIGLSPR